MKGKVLHIDAINYMTLIETNKRFIIITGLTQIYCHNKDYHYLRFLIHAGNKNFSQVAKFSAAKEKMQCKKNNDINTL